MGLFERKKRLTDYDFFNGFTDYHSHILFGVDDGVKSLEESLSVLEYYDSIGVRSVFLTPHINLIEHDWELIETNFKKLKDSYKGAIELTLAAEYMIDNGFNKELERGLKTINGDKVLVESSYVAKPANFEDMLYEIANSGVVPIIAHPERYFFMDTAEYKALKHRGYLFQLDILSLSGYYGKEAMKRGFYLLKSGMFDIIGSDLHNLRSFKNGTNNIKLTNSQYKSLQDILL